METNFFSVLAAIGGKGDWTMHIKADESDKLTVSILFKKTCGDNAAKIIPPLIFPAKDTGTLDTLFFKDLSLAIPKADQVLSTMEHYLKEVERAGKSSNAQQKKPAAGTSTVPKLSKYEEAIKLVDELESQGKYREAWMKVPEPSQYPEHTDFLRSRREALSRHFAPDLFGTTADSPVTENVEERPEVADESESDMPASADGLDEEQTNETEL
ncbi:MAG: hypothetical protein BGO31_12705 [Bacteroidetes bacterium 43-16]|nr:MAG: hypothetical protein BGO31_12705 [Bacteroidetes bacterium 43-16]